MMRTFFIICSFLVIEMIRVCGSVAAQYNEYETAKLREFLMQESAERGVWNFQQLGLTSINDISWGEIPGLRWSYPTWRLLSLEWPHLKLSGHLDVSDFQELRDLYCSFNEIDAVTVHNCPALINMDFYTNNLTEVDITTIPNVRFLRLGYNNIRNVDMSGNPYLMFFCCSNNQVEMLDFSNKELIETIYCIGNELHTLIVDNCIKLETLLCSQNALTNMNLHNLPSLTAFSCFNNSLYNLQFLNCPLLVEIDCSENELPVLDVSACESLTNLNCSNNQLASINMAGCNNLTTVNCKNNLLVSLDISNAPALSTLNCSFNFFSFLTLPPNKPPLKSYTYAPQSNISLTCKPNDVDLSDYYNAGGYISSFIWRNRHTVVTPLENNEGRFVFDESYIGDSLTCYVRNNFLPVLWLQFDVKFTEDGDSGNVNPAMEGLTVYAGEQAIHVTTATPATVCIYSLQGALHQKKTVYAGYTRIPIERGIYVAVVNDTISYKLIVR